MKNQKGIVLIWALIMTSIILFIGILITSYIAAEAQNTTNNTASQAAYSAARSGVEYALKRIDLNPAIGGFSVSNIHLNGVGVPGDPQASYSVTYDTTTTPPHIDSTGTAGVTTRKITYQINPKETKELDITNPSSVSLLTPPTTVIKGSIKITYNLWFSSAPTAFSPVWAAASDGANIYGAGIKYDGTNYFVCLRDSATPTCSLLSPQPTNVTEPYHFKVEFNYVKNLYYSARILERQGVISPGYNIGDYKCIGSIISAGPKTILGSGFTSLAFSTAPIYSAAGAGLSSETLGTFPSGSTVVMSNFLVSYDGAGIGTVPPLTYTINPTSDAGCFISPSTTQTVTGGGAVGFQGTHGGGNTNLGFSIDGGPTIPGNTYSFSSVSSSHTITAKCGSSNGSWWSGTGLMTGKWVYNSDSAYPSDSINWANAPAKCTAVGGRLPTKDEIFDILFYRTSYTNTFGGIDNYWSSTSYVPDGTYAWTTRNSTWNQFNPTAPTLQPIMKSSFAAIRCVKD